MVLVLATVHLLENTVNNWHVRIIAITTEFASRPSVFATRGMWGSIARIVML